MSKKRCKRCGKKWCGKSLNKRLIKIYGPHAAVEAPNAKTFGSKKCRDKGSKR